MKEILTGFFISTASLATADNFVDAMMSGDALLAECNVTIKDNYFDFTFSGLCKGVLTRQIKLSSCFKQTVRSQRMP